MPVEKQVYILLEFNIVLESLNSFYRSMSSAYSISSAPIDGFILETSSM